MEVPAVDDPGSPSSPETKSVVRREGYRAFDEVAVQLPRETNKTVLIPPVARRKSLKRFQERWCMRKKV